MLKVMITGRAIKDLADIDDVMKTRIAARLQELALDPLKHSRHLSDPRIGSYRARVGDHRIVFDIEGDELVVLRIGNRKTIYR